MFSLGCDLQEGELSLFLTTGEKQQDLSILRRIWKQPPLTPKIQERNTQGQEGLGKICSSYISSRERS